MIAYLDGSEGFYFDQMVYMSSANPKDVLNFFWCIHTLRYITSFSGYHWSFLCHFLTSQFFRYSQGVWLGYIVQRTNRSVNYAIVSFAYLTIVDGFIYIIKPFIKTLFRDPVMPSNFDTMETTRVN